MNTLILSCNHLTALPESITRLQNLTAFDLSDNFLTTVPESITHLKNLIILNLGFNALTTVPESIAGLKNLTALHLAANELTSVPESITRLQNLTTLDLSHNKLMTVPESITRLQNLTELYLGGNNLTTVPESITRLQNLTTLYLTGNPLVSPPIDVADKGIEAIRDYFRQIREEGVDRLYEAKLLIVGEAGAGKTSLMRKIKNPKYKLRQDDTTKGIEIVRWEFNTREGRKFRVNIWDFGGQEIYHSTHQFFLTKRSAYLLVADNRAEDTDFYYWLNIVQLLSQKSPLLIVNNEKLDRRRDIPVGRLREQFDCLVGIQSTSLATNRGLEDVVGEIKYRLETLPHIGEPLPRTWVNVRQALENDFRNSISIEEFNAVCDEHGFKREEDKLQLSGYLHDLGVCLHFHDDPVLKHRVILKPEWATRAVYKVLDLPAVRDNRGSFGMGELREIWSGDDYDQSRDELLALMVRFHLCYPIPGQRGRYIAPQLLGGEPPAYDWDDEENFHLRYKYEFMPKGIVTRFIVMVHDLIPQNHLVWKGGVIIERDGSRAEIVEDYGRREIRARFVGPLKSDLRGIVMREFEKVHALFDRLEVDTRIPCTCGECAKVALPYFFPFSDLLKFREKRRDDIQCRESSETVSVSELLREYIREEARRDEVDADKYPGMHIDHLTVNTESFSLAGRDVTHRKITRKRNSMKIEKVIVKGGSVTFADHIDKLLQIGYSGVDRKQLETLSMEIRRLSEENRKRIDSGYEAFAQAKTEPEKKSAWKKFKGLLLENGVAAAKDITVEIARALLFPKP